jgi:hypothetical protein
MTVLNVKALGTKAEAARLINEARIEALLPKRPRQIERL